MSAPDASYYDSGNNIQIPSADNSPPLSLRIFAHNIRRVLQFIGAKIIPQALHIRNNGRCCIRTEITQIRVVIIF